MNVPSTLALIPVIETRWNINNLHVAIRALPVNVIFRKRKTRALSRL